MNINEVKLDPADATKVLGGGTLANQMHFAWVNGGPTADTFNVATDISSATQTLMSANQRGVYVNLGAGDDTATGSGFGDNFDMGAGTNHVDGGANAGTAPPWGGKAVDSLDVFVADATAANAVSVTALSASSTGADLTAFNSGYTAKVSAGAEVDYIKNI